MKTLDAGTFTVYPYGSTIPPVHAALFGVSSEAAGESSAGVLVSSQGGGSSLVGIVSAKMSPVIVHPRPNDETNSWARHRHAYPGIEYSIPVAVVGGAFPFTYELTSAPSGATIGTYSIVGGVVVFPEDYGIVKWTPAGSGSAETFTVKVTDAEGTERTVTWTVTPGTSGWIFVDAENGNDSTGDGSINNPFQTIASWHHTSQTESSYSGYRVYWRAGTYDLSQAFLLGSDPGYVPMRTSKPAVHIAYPGETVIWDGIVGSGQSITMSWVDGAPNDIWVEGITMEFVRRAIIVESTRDRVVFYRNHFSGVGTGGGTNSAAVMFSNASVGDGAVFWGNTFDVSGADCVLIYARDYSVYEANVITGNVNANAWGFYHKDGFNYSSVRRNVGLSNVSQPLVRVDGYAPGGHAVEVAYNSYASQIFLAGTESTTGYGDFWVYRNSVNSGSGYAVRVAGPQAGAYIIEQNVIEYTGSSWSQTTGSGYTFTDRNNKVGSNVLESDHTQTGTPDYTVGHIIQAAA